MQKITLIGNLGGAPETRTSNDKEFYTAKLAVSTYDFKEKENKTTWYSVLFSENVAKNRLKVMTKGAKLYLEGSLTAKTYEDKNGDTKIDLSVSVFSFEIVSKIEKSEDSEEGEQKNSSKKDTGKTSKDKKKQSREEEEDLFGDDESDDLPF